MFRLKCSYNLSLIKVNRKPEITSVRSALYLCNKISIRKPIDDISHIQLFCFIFKISYKQNKNLNEVFHENLRSRFSIVATASPPVSFEIIRAGFSSRIFIFPPVHRLKKSDYSCLMFQ